MEHDSRFANAQGPTILRRSTMLSSSLTPVPPARCPHGCSSHGTCYAHIGQDDFPAGGSMYPDRSGVRASFGRCARGYYSLTYYWRGPPTCCPRARRPAPSRSSGHWRRWRLHASPRPRRAGARPEFLVDDLVIESVLPLLLAPAGRLPHARTFRRRPKSLLCLLGHLRRRHRA